MIGNMNIEDLMEQAKKLQQEMQKSDKRLEEQLVVGSAGGDMVTVKMNGKFQVLRVTLSKDALDEKDLSLLEDLVCSAFNSALEKAQKLSSNRYKDMLGGMGLPPGFSP